MLFVIEFTFFSFCFYTSRNLLAKRRNHDEHFRNYSILLSRSVAKLTFTLKLAFNQLTKNSIIVWEFFVRNIGEYWFPYPKTFRQLP